MRVNIPVCITLPPEVKSAAERCAENNYTNISQLIRGAIIEKLKKEGFLPAPTGAAPTEEAQP